MPIHINLLAEAQAAEELRRRDPVKRAAFIGVSLVLLTLMWSGMIETKSILAQESYAGVETQIAASTNAYQHAMVNQKAVNADKTKLEALNKLERDRFLQGNLLNALQKATVEGVQLTRLRVDQSYFLSEDTDNGTGGKAPPATVRQRIVLYLDARDSSANPGDLVNKFMTTIANEPYFQAMLDKTNGVLLTGPPSAPQSNGGKPYVLFEVECHYPDQIRSDD